MGSTLHLAGELFKARAGIDMLHVPYKGAGPAIAALVSGEVQVMLLTPPLSLRHIRAGKLRALAYTHASRADFLPDVPTMREAGVSDMEIDGGWHGLFAPAGTPRTVVDRLNSETRTALAHPSVRERLVVLGLDPEGNSPEEFRKFFDEQIRTYAEIVRVAGIRPE
jgi:tripartite-type tricarboxylate transporter receptor subunit TctC